MTAANAVRAGATEQMLDADAVQPLPHGLVHWLVDNGSGRTVCGQDSTRWDLQERGPASAWPWGAWCWHCFPGLDRGGAMGW